MGLHHSSTSLTQPLCQPAVIEEEGLETSYLWSARAENPSERGTEDYCMSIEAEVRPLPRAWTSPACVLGRIPGKSRGQTKYIGWRLGKA